MKTTRARNVSSNKKNLSPEQREELLRALKARFEKNMNRHKGLEWTKVQALQKPCIAGSRSRGNNQLKAKLLRPFGQRSDLLLTIPAFVVFGSFINVRLSVFDE